METNTVRHAGTADLSPDEPGLHLAPPAPEDAPALAALTWAAYRPVLTEAGALPSDGGARPVRLAAWRDGIAVGLGLAVAAPQAGTASLLSLMVTAAERRRGIGRALLRGLSEEARRLGCSRMHASWSDRLPGSAAFGALLARDGWTPPAAERLRICGPVKHTLALFRDRRGLIARMERGGLRFRSWAEAGPLAEAVAAEGIARGEVPDWADPARWRKSLCPDMSLVLTDADGAVRGWAVCEPQPALNRWYFPVGWVLPPQDKRGWLLGAYAEGARRLAAAHGDETLVVTETSPRLPEMWGLLDKHFRPLAHWTDCYMTSHVVLSPDDAGSAA